jgi:hypothetical protein
MVTLSDYTLYKILDENGYEPSEDNLAILREDLKSGKKVIFNTTNISLTEGASDDEAVSAILNCPVVSYAENDVPVKYAVSNKNIGIIKEGLNNGDVLLFTEEDDAPAEAAPAADATAPASDAAAPAAKAGDGELDTADMDDDHAKAVAEVTFKNAIGRGATPEAANAVAKRLYRMVAARDKKRAAGEATPAPAADNADADKAATQAVKESYMYEEEDPAVDDDKEADEKGDHEEPDADDKKEDTGDEDFKSREDAINFLIDDEKEAIDGYEKVLNYLAGGKAKDGDKDTLDFIKGQENEHIDKLNGLLAVKADVEADKAGVGDAVEEAKKAAKGKMTEPAAIKAAACAKGSCGK